MLGVTTDSGVDSKTPKIRELENKKWYRALKVLYWAIVSIGVLIVISVAILDLPDSNWVWAFIELLAWGVIVLVSISRLIVWSFLYIMVGHDEIGLTKGEDKFLLLPKKYLGKILALLGIAITFTAISGAVEKNRLKNENLNSNIYFEPPLSRNVSKLGPVSIESMGVMFSELEITNLGKILTSDFGYTRFDSIETAGTFMKVVFYISNTEKVNKSVEVLSLILVDQNGNNYPAERFFTCARPYNENQYYSSLDDLILSGSSLMTLKPGVPCKVSALFETSPSSNRFNLNVVWK